MNSLMLVVVALVALCYFGGNYCPSVLKQNKKMLLGGAIALVLCSFFGMNLEGFNLASNDGAIQFQESCCNSDGTYKTDEDCNNNEPNTPALKNALCSQVSNMEGTGSSMTGKIGTETASELMNRGSVSSLLAGLRNTRLANHSFNELCNMEREGLVGEEIDFYELACGPP